MLIVRVLHISAKRSFCPFECPHAVGPFFRERFRFRLPLPKYFKLLFDFGEDPGRAGAKFAGKVIADSGEACAVGEEGDFFFGGCAEKEGVESFEKLFDVEEEIPLW